MIRVWIGLLPSALGIAISVMPLLFLILMLTSRRGLANAISFCDRVVSRDRGDGWRVGLHLRKF